MATVDNILSLLGKWAPWKRIQETPERIDALEGRVRELEDKLRRAPGEACPRCGELEYRVASSRPHSGLGNMGVVERTMKCGACDYTEKKVITPE